MDKARKVLIYVLLTVGAILMVFPFFWMITGSIKTYNEIIANPIVWWPKKVLLDNYVTAASYAPFVLYFKNTLIVSFFNTFLTLLTTILASFAFSRLIFKGRDLLFSILLSTLMIPSQMLIITNYVTIAKMGKMFKALPSKLPAFIMETFPSLNETIPNMAGMDTYSALIIPFTASIFYIYMLRQFFNQIPEQLYFAAKVDGCSDWKYLWTIMVPNSKNALITIGLFNWIASWNAYIWPLLVTNTVEKRVLSIGLKYFSGEAGTDYHLLMAAGTIVVMPLLILYLFARKYIIEGVSRSGTKG